jgi:hypothetical protein
LGCIGFAFACFFVWTLAAFALRAFDTAAGLDGVRALLAVVRAVPFLPFFAAGLDATAPALAFFAVRRGVVDPLRFAGAAVELALTRVPGRFAGDDADVFARLLLFFVAMGSSYALSRGCKGDCLSSARVFFCARGAFHETRGSGSMTTRRIRGASLDPCRARARAGLTIRACRPPKTTRPLSQWRITWLAELHELSLQLAGRLVAPLAARPARAAISVGLLVFCPAMAAAEPLDAGLPQAGRHRVTRPAA